MTQLAREEIISAVYEALRNHPCRFDVGPKEVDHLVGMVVDIGAAATGDPEGSFRAGVEQLRKAHLWLIDRIKHDNEYTENHKAMSAARDLAGSFGNKLAHFVMWVFVCIVAVALVLTGWSKLGGMKIGG